VLELENHVQLAARRVGVEHRLLHGAAGRLTDVEQPGRTTGEDLAVHLLEELAGCGSAADTTSTRPCTTVIRKLPTGPMKSPPKLAW
jgi:hypothetical protein